MLFKKALNVYGVLDMMNIEYVVHIYPSLITRKIPFVLNFQYLMFNTDNIFSDPFTTSSYASAFGQRNPRVSSSFISAGKL